MRLNNLSKKLTNEPVEIKRSTIKDIQYIIAQLLLEEKKASYHLINQNLFIFIIDDYQQNLTLFVKNEKDQLIVLATETLDKLNTLDDANTLVNYCRTLEYIIQKYNNKKVFCSLCEREITIENAVLKNSHFFCES